MDGSRGQTDAIIAGLKPHIQCDVCITPRGIGLHQNRYVQCKEMIEYLRVEIKIGVMFLDRGSSRWRTRELHDTVGVGGNTKWRWAPFCLIESVNVPTIIDTCGEVERQPTPRFGRGPLRSLRTDQLTG